VFCPGIGNETSRRTCGGFGRTGALRVRPELSVDRWSCIRTWSDFGFYSSAVNLNIAEVVCAVSLELRWS
jgi:hypothetical protein